MPALRWGCTPGILFHYGVYGSSGLFKLSCDRYPILFFDYYEFFIGAPAVDAGDRRRGIKYNGYVISFLCDIFSTPSFLPRLSNVQISRAIGRPGDGEPRPFDFYSFTGHVLYKTLKLPRDYSTVMRKNPIFFCLFCYLGSFVHFEGNKTSGETGAIQFFETEILRSVVSWASPDLKKCPSLYDVILRILRLILFINIFIFYICIIWTLWDDSLVPRGSTAHYTLPYVICECVVSRDYASDLFVLKFLQLILFSYTHLP